MWVSGLDLLLYSILFFIMYEIKLARSHIPSYLPTPSSPMEQYCAQADVCVHDTIPVCGKMGDEKKVFLDICDMIEYACDTNRIYLHVEDENCETTSHH